jgi:hypothetical protein
MHDVVSLRDLHVQAKVQTPTLGKRGNSLKFDSEVVLVVELCWVVDELNVADIYLKPTFSY